MLGKFDLFEKYPDDSLSDYICLFIGVNDLAIYNTFATYLTGDAILEQTKELLTEQFEYENVFRFSNARFIVMYKIPANKLDDYNYRDKMKNTLATIIKEKIENKLSINENEEKNEITISVGISSNGRLSQIETTFELVKYADIALSVARKDKKQSFVTDESFISEKLDQEEIKENIENALHKEEFKPYFQPIVSNQTTNIVGCETFLRWERNYRVIGPNKFLDFAKDKGVLYQVDFSIIEQVFQSYNVWREDELVSEDFILCINISYQSLEKINFKEVKEMAKKYNVNTKNIYFELQSDVFKKGELRKKIENIKKLGFCITIDNFGGADISFKSIIEAGEFDVIKINRELLPKEENFEIYSKVYNSLVKFGEIFDVSVIAQGIENKEHVNFCKNSGVTFSQGFYFSNVLNEDNFRIYLNKYKKGIFE